MGGGGESVYGKWTPITGDHKLTNRAIVTVQRISPPGCYVTIGLPGWGLWNNTIAYMPLPENIIDNPGIWKSEYVGDEFPENDGWYIVQLQTRPEKHYNKLEVDILYFDAKRYKWLAVPEGWEVIGWMNRLPEPPRSARCF